MGRTLVAPDTIPGLSLCGAYADRPGLPSRHARRGPPRMRQVVKAVSWSAQAPYL